MLSCGQDPAIKPMAFELESPANFGATVPQPEYNKATKEGIALGKKLFFDKRLSQNNDISCGSCHLPEKAFSDFGKQFSIGNEGKILKRNTQALFNLAWETSFFWDGGAKNLESQVFAPLQAHDEMNANLDSLQKELSKIDEYKSLFKKAFDSDEISSVKVAWAIAQYERSLISANSNYDKWVRNEGFSLSSIEQKGFDIFKIKCATCHKADLFADGNFHNNGLDSTFDDSRFENLYKGRFRITTNEADLGKYKIPSLRNLKFTAPYMHDGRFATLTEVINHYSNGIKTSPTLSEKLPKEGFRFTPEERESLIAFLNTLNDNEFTK